MTIHGERYEDQLRRELDEAETEIERLRGAMGADDQRLRAAAERVGLAFGCDSADAMADEIETLRVELQTVTDCLDDILYDPQFHPRDEYGHEIRGNDLYLLPHPVQECHMPALREWFVRHCNEAAQAGGGE